MRYVGNAVPHSKAASAPFHGPPSYRICLSDIPHSSGIAVTVALATHRRALSCGQRSGLLDKQHATPRPSPHTLMRARKLRAERLTPMWWLSFRGGSVVIVTAASLVHARLLAAIEFDHASHFVEGYPIDPDLEELIPVHSVGRMLSPLESRDLIKLLKYGTGPVAQKGSVDSIDSVRPDFDKRPPAPSVRAPEGYSWHRARSARKE
jgi:hypothetical protein